MIWEAVPPSLLSTSADLTAVLATVRLVASAYDMQEE